MAITLKDIARYTGFSVTTVSRALAGYDDVNLTTKQSIIRAAELLGYQPNLVARQLQAQRTRTIGMVLPQRDLAVTGDFFTELLRGVSDKASEADYDILTSTQIYGSEGEMSAYRRMVGGGRVDGMIIGRARRQDERIAYLLNLNFPFAVSGSATEGEPGNYPYIDMDNRSGIQQAAAHLIDLGHQRIGLILPPDGTATSAPRHQGYRDALAAAGLPYDAALVRHAEFQPASGEVAGGELLDAHPDITAIVACSDLMALGAMKAASQRGLSVGDDLAITGFDDIPLAQYANPPLTTVHQPIYEIGRQLAANLIDILEGLPVQPVQTILPATLIVRASSSPRKIRQPADATG